MEKIKTLVILNPVSGNRKKGYVEKYLTKHFNSQKFDYELVYTKYSGHGYKISSDAANLNYHLVVVVGGDGMINEVARGLFNSNTIMGIIPFGSGNGLARHLSIPLNAIKAIKIINNYKWMFMDTYIINKEGFFCNMAGVGFDGLVAKEFAGNKRRGFLTYFKIIVKNFVSFKHKRFNIVFNSKELNFKAFMVNFANSSQFGNNAVIAPMASVTDGMLNICIVKCFKWYYAPYFGLMLLLGKIDKTSFVTYFKTSEVKLEIIDDNYLHLDGDPYELGKSICIKPNKESLKVIIP